MNLTLHESICECIINEIEDFGTPFSGDMKHLVYLAERDVIRWPVNGAWLLGGNAVDYRAYIAEKRAHVGPSPAPNNQSATAKGRS